MKFERKEITDIVFVQHIERPYTKCCIIRKGTDDVMQCAGRLQNTDKFVFKNISKNAYCEYTQKEVCDKLYLEVPTLEIGDLIAVWQPATDTFVYLLIQTDESARIYNNRNDWRLVTQAEWKQLNKPISSSKNQPVLSLSQEETKVLQKRIEKAIVEAVKEAFVECKKKRDAKHIATSTEKQCENNWCENEL